MMYSVCEPISEDGYPYIRWIHFLFGTCVYSNWETASSILGIVSVSCWLCAQFPQIITNYRNKSADGLSLYFLMNWLLGDLTNLVGCILTNQSPFQTNLAIYFCSVDFGLFSQYFYYSWFYPSKSASYDQDVLIGPEVPPGSRLSMTSLRDSILEGAKKSYTFPELKKGTHKRISSMVFAVLLLTFHSTSIIKPSLSTTLPNNHSRVIYFNDVTLHNDDQINSNMFIGRIMAWACTVLYLTSRMPQIWKNYTRKSVEGLSIFLFIFAALGNLAYTLNIFTNPLAAKDPNFLREAVPYILGSIGTLSFDTVVFLQWLAWRDPDRRKFRRSQNYSGSEIDYQQVPNVRNSRNSGTLYDHRRHDYMIDDGFLA